MCRLRQASRSADSLAVPLNVRALQAFSAVRCIVFWKYKNLLDKQVICPPCFHEKIPVQRRDLFKLKTKHWIIRGNVELKKCSICHTPAATDTAIADCNRCAIVYFEFIQHLRESGETAGINDPEPLIIHTDFSSLH